MQQRQRYQAVEKLRETLDEKYLWAILAFVGLYLNLVTISFKRFISFC